MKFSLAVLSSLCLSALAHAQTGNLAPPSAGERPADSTEKEIGLAIGTAPRYDVYRYPNSSITPASRRTSSSIRSAGTRA
jgi:hypothetical protein